MKRLSYYRNELNGEFINLMTLAHEMKDLDDIKPVKLTVCMFSDLIIQGTRQLDKIVNRIFDRVQEIRKTRKTKLAEEDEIFSFYRKLINRIKVINLITLAIDYDLIEYERQKTSPRLTTEIRKATASILSMIQTILEPYGIKTMGDQNDKEK